MLGISDCDESESAAARALLAQIEARAAQEGTQSLGVTPLTLTVFAALVIITVVVIGVGAYFSAW